MKKHKAEKRTRIKTSPEYLRLKQENDPFRRKIQFLALIAKKLRDGGESAILAGGQAIDFYTAGLFATTDIDLVVTNRALTEKWLNKFGFKQEDNELWFSSELSIVIHVISREYSGDSSKLKKFDVKGYELRVAAPEDLIAGRLYSVKHWKSNPQRDFEQIVSLLKIFDAKLDDVYLDGLARRDNTVDVLGEARQVSKQL